MPARLRRQRLADQCEAGIADGKTPSAVALPQVDAEEQWLLRPRLRYYTQGDAYFYSDLDPIEVQDDRFYTADQRLGAFGGITAGLKLMKQFGSGYTGSIAYDFSASDGDWTVGSQGSPRVPRLYMNYLSLQIAKRF